MLIPCHLSEGADIAPVREDLVAFVDRHYPVLPIGPEGNAKPSTAISHDVINIQDIQLYSYGAMEMKPIGSIKTVTWYIAIATIVLIIAAINFTNLSTTRATQRSREVAIRKVAGASKRDVIFQFLGVSVFLTVLALFLALVVVEVALGPYNDALGKELVLNYTSSFLLPFFLVVAILVGVAGGIYPAFVVSSHRPSQVLKANKSSETAGSSKLITGD